MLSAIKMDHIILTQSPFLIRLSLGDPNTPPSADVISAGPLAMDVGEPLWDCPKWSPIVTFVATMSTQHVAHSLCGDRAADAAGSRRAVTVQILQIRLRRRRFPEKRN